MIEVEGPDGAVIEFPDGTAPETMKAALAKHYGGAQQPPARAPNAAQRVAGGAAKAIGGGIRDFNKAIGPLALVNPLTVFEDTPEAASVRKGASFGFSDEIAGAIGGEQAGRAARDQQRQFAQDRPVANFIGEASGGIASAVATGGGFVAAGKTLAQQSARGAGVGAAQAALAGAGNAEGGLGERAKGAAIAAPFGAALGAAAPYLGSKVAQFWRARSGGVRAPTEVKRSYDSLVKVLEADLGSRGKAEAAIRKYVQSGQGDILDIAGGKTLARIREVASRNPQSALAFVDDVKAEAVSDIRGAVAGRLNTKGGTTAVSREALKLARQQQAGPLFRQASQTPVPQGFANDLLARPDVGSAFRKATRELSNSQEGTPFEVLKVTKENLDDRITALIRASKPAEARRLQIPRDALRERLTQLSPEYADALNIWAGSKAADDALDLGAQFLKPTFSPEDLTLALKGMTKSEREFVRVAVAEQFEDAIANTRDGLNTARRFATPAIRDKVRALFVDDQAEAEAFIRIVQRAEDRVRKANVIDPFGGSQTQPRGAASAEFLAESSGPVTRSASAVTSGIASPTTIPQKVVTKLAGQRGEAQAQRVSELLASTLFEGAPLNPPTRPPLLPSPTAARAAPAAPALLQNRE